MYATIDIETTGLNRFKDTITWIGVQINKVADSINKGEDSYIKQYIFDMRENKDLPKFIAVCDKLKSKKVKTVFQNGKFDTLFIETQYGIKLPITEDVMLMATAYDLAEEHGLKYLAKKYLGVPDWDISNKEKTSGSDSIIPYLKCDVKYTWMLFCYFKEHMTPQHIKIYKQILKPAYLMYRDTERNGIYIDLDKLKDVRKKYKDLEQEKLDWLNSKYKINWNSPAQIAEVLFSEDKENCPVIKKSEKTNKPSANAEVLNKLARKGYEIPKVLLEYKAANTLNKMFLNRWEDDLGFDKRIHPSFNLTNVVTGRTSCQNPNLQQVPREKDVRGMFDAPKGRLFFEADYSQLELRIAAEYSHDPVMLDIYKNNGDIHTTTAKLMTGGREPTKEERSKAKAVNFGFLYGMSARTFVDYAYNSYGAVFSKQEAELFREAFFAKYIRLLPWHKEMEYTCEMLGGVANKFGRFRKLPDIYCQDNFLRSKAARRAINTPVQGTGSDLLISAATKINHDLKKEGVKIVGTVHDSILGEFRKEDKEWVCDYIRKVMLHPPILDEFGVELEVPLDIDIGVGAWGTH
jgi:DNA polymerase I - 3''-5'' exonuclease and polymerase domains